MVLEAIGLLHICCSTNSLLSWLALSTIWQSLIEEYVKEGTGVIVIYSESRWLGYAAFGL